jgi:hypothetical protein
VLKYTGSIPGNKTGAFKKHKNPACKSPHPVSHPSWPQDSRHSAPNRHSTRFKMTLRLTSHNNSISEKICFYWEKVTRQQHLSDGIMIQNAMNNSMKTPPEGPCHSFSTSGMELVYGKE